MVFIFYLCIMDCKEFIINKMNECIIVESDTNNNVLYWITSPILIRNLKLSRITGEQLSYDPKNDINKRILFHQDKINKIFYLNRRYIVYILKYHYNLKEKDIKYIVESILNNNIISKKYIIYRKLFFFKYKLLKNNNLKSYKLLYDNYANFLIDFYD